METKIVSNRGHYDVYIDGDLYCSADSWREAETEIKEYKEQSEVFKANENFDLKP